MRKCIIDEAVIKIPKEYRQQDYICFECLKQWVFPHISSDKIYNVRESQYPDWIRALIKIEKAQRYKDSEKNEVLFCDIQGDIEFDKRI